MDALLIGTGGAGGWPQPDCSCASCMRARAAGAGRRSTEVLLDGELALLPGARPARATAGGTARHTVIAIPGGWDITGADGSRLLAAGGPGMIPEPPDGTAAYDLALLDLVASPAQIGRLRAAGLLHRRSTVATIYADHRTGSAAELTRRCELWGVLAGQDGQLLTGPAPDTIAAAPVRPHRTLILGGARSGKSREAELRLSAEPSVTYLAAGPWPDDSWTGENGEPDAEWAARVAAHRAARPSWWRTEESLDLAGALRRESGAILIDGIGTWLAAIMEQSGVWAVPGRGPAGNGRAQDNPERLLAGRIEELMAAWRQTGALVVAVTDQVGSGLVPVYQAGRRFRDQLGWLNQRLAAESEVTVLVVAGQVMTFSVGP